MKGCKKPNSVKPISKLSNQKNFCWDCNDKCDTVCVLGQGDGYMVKYTTLPKGVPEGKAQGNSWMQSDIFYRIYWDNS